MYLSYSASTERIASVSFSIICAFFNNCYIIQFDAPGAMNTTENFLAFD